MRTIDLASCLAAADRPDFADQLTRALAALPPGSLPLNAACTQGGMVDESDLTFSVLAVEHNSGLVRVRVGVLFVEVVGGCNCHDDPAASNAYGVLQLVLDRSTGNATASITAG